jgi:hypothetical protein
MELPFLYRSMGLSAETKLVLGQIKPALTTPNDLLCRSRRDLDKIEDERMLRSYSGGDFLVSDEAICAVSKRHFMTEVSDNDTVTQQPQQKRTRFGCKSILNFVPTLSEALFERTRPSQRENGMVTGFFEDLEGDTTIVGKMAEEKTFLSSIFNSHKLVELLGDGSSCTSLLAMRAAIYAAALAEGEGNVIYIDCSSHASPHIFKELALKLAPDVIASQDVHRGNQTSARQYSEEYIKNHIRTFLKRIIVIDVVTPAEALNVLSVIRANAITAMRQQHGQEQGQGQEQHRPPLIVVDSFHDLVSKLHGLPVERSTTPTPTPNPTSVTLTARESLEPSGNTQSRSTTPSISSTSSLRHPPSTSKDKDDRDLNVEIVTSKILSKMKELTGFGISIIVVNLATQRYDFNRTNHALAAVDPDDTERQQTARIGALTLKSRGNQPVIRALPLSAYLGAFDRIFAVWSGHFERVLPLKLVAS